MINYQEEEGKMGETRIILRQGLTEEEIGRTITEVRRELTRLDFPEGEREGEIITLKRAIPEGEIIRFSLLPRVKEVIIED